MEKPGTENTGDAPAHTGSFGNKPPRTHGALRSRLGRMLIATGLALLAAGTLFTLGPARADEVAGGDETTEGETTEEETVEGVLSGGIMSNVDTTPLDLGDPENTGSSCVADGGTLVNVLFEPKEYTLDTSTDTGKLAVKVLALGKETKLEDVPETKFSISLQSISSIYDDNTPNNGKDMEAGDLPDVTSAQNDDVTISSNVTTTDVSLGSITYKRAGYYVYKVTETKGTDARWAYDPDATNETKVADHYIGVHVANDEGVLVLDWIKSLTVSAGSAAPDYAQIEEKGANGSLTISNVYTNKQEAVTFKQHIPEAVGRDTWFTVQIVDKANNKTYRQAIKVPAGKTEGEAKVMLHTGHEYEITTSVEQRSWRYEETEASYSNSSADGGDDTWTASSAGSDTENLPATLTLTYTADPKNDRVVDLSSKLSKANWDSDTTSIVNTMS